MRLCAVSAGMGITCAYNEHFQQNCQAVLRRIMRWKKAAFPAKVQSGFALDNATNKAFSSSSKVESGCGHDGKQLARAFHFRHRRKALFPASPAWPRL